LGDATKLLLHGRHALFEPDWSDWISVAVHGGNADRNNHLPLLGFGQLIIVEWDDDESGALLRDI
jgi:hypothetical protein